MIKKELTIFHYHLLPGGVTSVILLGLKALTECRDTLPVEKIRIVSGGSFEKESSFRQSVEELASSAPGKGIEFRCESFPAIGYAPAGENPGEDAEASKILAGELLERYGNSVWWVHNHHLGKNVRFTRALLETAEKVPSQKILFQIHDFPENGRLPNWQSLKKRIPGPLYPGGAGITYLTINRRDKEILASANLPAHRIHLLPNPVDASAGGGNSSPGTTRKILEDKFAADFPAYRRGAPTALYPVRTIRRKNILEAGLAAAIFPGGANLIVTLPGTSAQEKPYSDLVDGLYRGGVIPGMWGTGTWRGGGAPSFEDVAASADFILSTSLQEGFGYFFIDAFRWGRPLLSRRLDILEELLPLLPQERAAVFGGLKIPRDPRWSQAWKEHLNEKRRFISEATGLELPADGADGGFDGPGGFDFAALHPEQQKEVLERTARDEGYKRAIEQLNSVFLTAAGKTLAECRKGSPEGGLEKLKKEWGLEGFARRTGAILQKVLEEDPADLSRGDEESVLKAFITPEGLRPLFSPYSGGRD